MPRILPFLFLLTDPGLLSELLHRGLECGLMILVGLGATALANAARTRSKKAASSVAQ